MQGTRSKWLADLAQGNVALLIALGALLLLLAPSLVMLVGIGRDWEPLWWLAGIGAFLGPPICLGCGLLVLPFKRRLGLGLLAAGGVLILTWLGLCAWLMFFSGWSDF